MLMLEWRRFKAPGHVDCLIVASDAGIRAIEFHGQPEAASPEGRSNPLLRQAIDQLRKAVRAVGAANGRNPIPIVVPCHRVIGAGGSLVGYGGGLPLKRFLLDLETRHGQLFQDA